MPSAAEPGSWEEILKVDELAPGSSSTPPKDAAETRRLLLEGLGDWALCEHLMAFIENMGASLSWSEENYGECKARGRCLELGSLDDACLAKRRGGWQGEVRGSARQPVGRQHGCRRTWKDGATDETDMTGCRER